MICYHTAVLDDSEWGAWVAWGLGVKDVILKHIIASERRASSNALWHETEQAKYSEHLGWGLGLNKTEFVSKVTAADPAVARDLLSSWGDHACFKRLTMLHVAALEGNVKGVRILLEAGAEVDVRSVDTLTPLHCAADTGNMEVMRLLVEMGADVNAKAGLNMGHVTPLMVAACTGQDKAVRWLVEKGAKVDAKNSAGVTALPMACRRSFPRTVARVVQALIELGADAHEKDFDGQAPLHYAARFQDYGLVSTLEEMGAMGD
eukprot:5300243-Pyramimonas_sp.AAC.1